MVDENVVENTEKETTEDWEKFVRSEIAAALDNFLPFALNGNLGIVYKKAVIEELETGPVYDDKKVSGVEIVIDLNFSSPVERPA